MMLEPRDLAAAESYPTFWDETPHNPIGPTVLPDDAYSTFVNLTDDDLQMDVLPEDE